MARATNERLQGCLVGALVGDALAFPYGGLSPTFTAALDREAVGAYRPHRSCAYPPGQLGSLGSLTLAVAEAVAEFGPTGDAVGGAIYPLVRDRRLVEPPPGLLAAVEAWARGRAGPPREGAEPPVHLLPMAIAAGDADELPWDALPALARVTGHDAPDSLARGAAFLAAVRFSLARGDIVLGELIDAARSAAARFSARVAEDVHRIPDLLFVAERDGFGPAERGSPRDATFQVLAGLTSFLKSPYDCERSLLIALRSGAGETAAFVCGALGGAFNGEGKVPQALREGLAAREDGDRCAAALAAAAPVRTGC